MHKDIAKKPGRSSQKRASTFTSQVAVRLAERHVIDYAYQQICSVPKFGSMDNSCTTGATPSGSSFSLHISLEEDRDGNYDYQVQIQGNGSLKTTDLNNSLYPDLIEFLICYFESKESVPTTIACSTEFRDEFGAVHRAHHDYKGNGFWHDWCWASYLKEDSEDEFQNVPAKVLCFLRSVTFADGTHVPDYNHVVLHASQWDVKALSLLTRQWKMVEGNKRLYNGIPYDVVDVSAINGNCFVVPFNDSNDNIMQISEKEVWWSSFE
jgi:hypothetical protein